MSERDVTCPYCDKDFEVSTNDGAHYKDGETSPEECPNCEKTVLIYSSCSWFREAQKADCLNGEPHPWSPWRTIYVGTEGENKGRLLGSRYCQQCDENEREWHDGR